MTDPLITSEMIRATLKRQIERHKETYAGLSRMLRKDDRYLDRFVRDGRPERLERGDIEVLARYFRIDPMLLGGKRRRSR